MNDIKGIIEDVEKSDLVSDKVIKKVIEIIGQEKWQDIHDEKSDICTTTGELIINLKGIPELEKENAELKKENEELPTIVFQQGAEWYKKKADIKLIKAKEIIKELLDTQSRLDPYRDIFKDRILKAEQFLKEIEK